MGRFTILLGPLLTSLLHYGRARPPDLWRTGLLMEAGFLVLAGVRQPAAHLPLVLGTYTLLFLLMLHLFYRDRGTALSLSRPQRQLLWGFALLFRLTLFFAPPTLSDDIYRYAWEGRVQRAGFSPYDYPPSAPELAFLRGPTHELINHKEIPTIYPPLTQMAFRLGSYLSDALGGTRAEVFSQKFIFLLFDWLTLGVLAMLLKQRALPEGRLLYYAWNPLVVLEFAGSGHNDSLGIFYLLAGLWLWGKSKPVWGSAALAASFLAKYFSVLLVPFFLWRRRWKALISFGLLAFIGVIPFCACLPDRQACWMMTHGAQHYLANWQFNGSLYALLEAGLGRADLAKKAAVGLLAVAAGVVGKMQQDIVRAAYLLVIASLLLAPVVHPWYFIWLVPFLCFFRNAAFIIWNGTIFLSYTVLRRYALYQVWDLHPAVQWLEYAPVYGLLVWMGFLHYEHRRHHSHA